MTSMPEVGTSNVAAANGSGFRSAMKAEERVHYRDWLGKDVEPWQQWSPTSDIIGTGPTGTNKITKTFYRHYFKYKSILNDIFRDCTAKNWDGRGAEPVSSAAIDEARRLLESLPNHFGPTDVSPDPDGFISFEWENNQGYYFMAGVGGNGVLSFIAKLPDDDILGRDRFPGFMPEFAIKMIERIVANG